MINEEQEIERQVDDMLRGICVDSICQRNKVGDYIKKYKHLFTLIDKMKAKHFNHEWFVKKYLKK